MTGLLSTNSALPDVRTHPRSAAAVDPAALESSALMHALAMLSELMVIANAETREVELAETLQPPPTATSSEWGMLLAQSITAVLRRALPALRIASMWLLSNADYLARYDSTAATFKPASASEGGAPSTDFSAPPPEVCMAIRGFWNTYVRCVNSLSRAFPADIMSPVASASGELMLEEDIDMLGFMPLRRRMKEASIGKAAKEVSGALASAAAASSTLHPNEEQVLRIGDLLSDAKLLAQSEVGMPRLVPPPAAYADTMHFPIRSVLPGHCAERRLRNSEQAPQPGLAIVESEGLAHPRRAGHLAAQRRRRIRRRVGGRLGRWRGLRR